MVYHRVRKRTEDKFFFLFQHVNRTFVMSAPRFEMWGFLLATSKRVGIRQLIKELFQPGYTEIQRKDSSHMLEADGREKATRSLYREF